MVTYNTNDSAIFVVCLLSIDARDEGKRTEEKKAPGDHANGNRPVALGASSHSEWTTRQ